MRKLYDLVLIPALALAGQDRQRNDLDEQMDQFVRMTTRELTEELDDPLDDSQSSAGQIFWHMRGREGWRGAGD